MLKILKARFKRYFVAGLLVVGPLYLTYYILSILVGFMDHLLTFLPPKFHPDTYLPFHIPGLGVIISVLVVLLVGLIARNFFGKKVLEGWESLLSRIPLIRSVYTGTKQFIETFFITNKGGFKSVVVIEYPRKGLYSIGFVTGDSKGEVQTVTSEQVLNVFIPTTPNPTSGWYVLVPEGEAIPLEMSVEEAFKLIISGGMVTPGEANMVGETKELNKNNG
ncbi:MAG: DUF502 domain-containing protein [Thermodesulfobacteriota bacterium]